MISKWKIFVVAAVLACVSSVAAYASLTYLAPKRSTPFILEYADPKTYNITDLYVDPRNFVLKTENVTAFYWQPESPLNRLLEVECTFDYFVGANITAEVRFFIHVRLNDEIVLSHTMREASFKTWQSTALTIQHIQCRNQTQYCIAIQVESVDAIDYIVFRNVRLTLQATEG